MEAGVPINVYLSNLIFEVALMCEKQYYMSLSLLEQDNMNISPQKDDFKDSQ